KLAIVCIGGRKTKMAPTQRNNEIMLSLMKYPIRIRSGHLQERSAFSRTTSYQLDSREHKRLRRKWGKLEPWAASNASHYSSGLSFSITDRNSSAIRKRSSIDAFRGTQIGRAKYRSQRVNGSGI